VSLRVYHQNTRCRTKVAQVIICSSPSDPVGFPPRSMRSIAYMVILTRQGLERFDCSKMTAVDFLASTAGQKVQNLLAGNGASSFSGIRRGRKLFWSAAVSTNPNCCDTSVTLSQLETSRPRGSERVAFIAFGNLRSFTRYGWLVIGKLDHFTAPVAGYRLYLFRKEISNIKFDYFRHNVVLFTRTRQSCLRTNTTRCSRDDCCLLLWHTFLLFAKVGSNTQLRLGQKCGDKSIGRWYRSTPLDHTSLRKDTSLQHAAMVISSNAMDSQSPLPPRRNVPATRSCGKRSRLLKSRAPALLEHFRAGSERRLQRAEPFVSE